jgi:hypothetical protein
MKASQNLTSGQALEHPVFFISNRPESYEVWGEISLGEAEVLARLIVEHASRRFPDIEFKIDGEWHTQDKSIKVQHAAAYIESHWQSWAAAMVDE